MVATFSNTVVESLSYWQARACHKATIQLLAMDASARITMKDAAKCDTHCELQSSANQQIFERIRHSQASPESMSASEPLQLVTHRVLNTVWCTAR